jgi:thermitase
VIAPKRTLALPWHILFLSLVCIAALTIASGTQAAPREGSSASIPDELLVKPRSGAAPGAFGKALDQAGAKQIGVVPELGVRIVHVNAANRGRALSSLRGAAGIAFAEPNGLTPSAEVVPNDAWWVSQFSQRQTHTDKAWGLTEGTPNVKIAVLDSGVDLSQPDLTDNLLPGRDFYNNDSNPSDDNGHGTVAAGVAAGRSDNGIGIAGYCGRCSILPVKISGADGNATWSAMASGLTWAADQGARVINLSFAGSSGSSTVQSAVKYAHDHGAVITVSAGNYGTSSPTYPAAYSGALAVAAVTSSDARSSYSNYGSWVQLAAPGTNYATARTNTTPLFTEFAGTSSAAPAVAGIAGLAFSYSPSATNTQLEQALESGAVANSFSQYGRVDAWGALSALGATSPTATAPLNGGAPVIVTSTGAPLPGSPQPGQAIGASGGNWSGAPAIGLSFRWQRCDSLGAGCSAITGATSQTYTPTMSDSGYTLRAAVTATNSLGSATAISQPSLAVGGSSSETPTEPSPTPTPIATTTTFSGSLTKQPSKSFSLAVGTGDTIATLTFNKAPSLALTLLAPDGSTVGGVSGASGIQLSRSLAAGTYRYLVSGSVKKGSASFTLGVSHTAP